MTIDLDAIRARAEAATPGPWTMRDGWGPTTDGLMHFTRIANGDHDSVLSADGPDIAGSRANAEFIAHARHDIPALLAEVDRLRSQLDVQLGQVIDERDRAEETADDLADLVGEIVGEEVGEHSSDNDPRANALRAGREYVRLTTAAVA